MDEQLIIGMMILALAASLLFYWVMEKLSERLTARHRARRAAPTYTGLHLKTPFPAVYVRLHPSASPRAAASLRRKPA